MLPGGGSVQVHRRPNSPARYQATGTPASAAKPATRVVLPDPAGATKSSGGWRQALARSVAESLAGDRRGGRDPASSRAPTNGRSEVLAPLPAWPVRLAVDPAHNPSSRGPASSDPGPRILPLAPVRVWSGNDDDASASELLRWTSCSVGQRLPNAAIASPISSIGQVIRDDHVHEIWLGCRPHDDGLEPLSGLRVESSCGPPSDGVPGRGKDFGPERCPRAGGIEVGELVSLQTGRAEDREDHRPLGPEGPCSTGKANLRDAALRQRAETCGRAVPTRVESLRGDLPIGLRDAQPPAPGRRCVRGRRQRRCRSASNDGAAPPAQAATPNASTIVASCPRMPDADHRGVDASKMGNDNRRGPMPKLPDGYARGAWSRWDGYPARFRSTPTPGRTPMMKRLIQAIRLEDMPAVRLGRRRRAPAGGRSASGDGRRSGRARHRPPSARGACGRRAGHPDAHSRRTDRARRGPGPGDDWSADRRASHWWGSSRSTRSASTRPNGSPGSRSWCRLSPCSLAAGCRKFPSWPGASLSRRT